MTDSEELKALSFVRRSLLRKNEKLLDMAKKLEDLQFENDNLKWKCEEQEQEILRLQRDLEISQPGIDNVDFEDDESTTNQFRDQERNNIHVGHNSNDVSDGPLGDESFHIKSEDCDLEMDDVDKNQDYQDFDPSTRFSKQSHLSEGDDVNSHMLKDVGYHETGKQNENQPSPKYIDGEGSQLLSERLCASDPNFQNQDSLLPNCYGGTSTTLSQTTSSSPVKPKLSSVCSLCGLQSRDVRDHTRHMMTHTGEKPFRCPHCPYRATLKQNLKRHVIRRHPQQHLARCSWCGATFITQDDLDIHLINRH